MEVKFGCVVVENHWLGRKPPTREVVIRWTLNYVRQAVKKGHFVHHPETENTRECNVIRAIMESWITDDEISFIIDTLYEEHIVLHVYRMDGKMV